MQATAPRTSFRIMADGEMIAAADSINAIADSVRYFHPDIYQVEEVIDGNRGAGRRAFRFWGWVTHRDDGIVAVEPCLSVLEG
ncbi:MAG TPA: hypothetical protein VHS97_22390 [Isosphaeraceae bacterium]|nr:hypothetical protein [Isosphaeraceae bacterium]